MIDMDVEGEECNFEDEQENAKPSTAVRILEVVSFEDSSSSSKDGSTTNEKKAKLSIIEKRKRMMRRNALSNFYFLGKRSISMIFTTKNSPEEIKWKDISPTFRTKKKKINHEHVKKAQTMQQMSSPPKRVMSPTKAISLNRINSTKEPLRPISNQYAEEFTSDHSILSSYPIMNVVEDFLKEETEDEEDTTMNEVFEHWIKVFNNTCHQQIKDVVLTTNRSISQYIDLNGNGLINGQQNFIKVLTIPTWPQVRILEDKTSQRYIALKKSHSSSWFVLPRECPKLNQQWVCYPIHSLNTFENELRMTEEDSIQRILLRMMILKCFNKIHKNDIVPINFDINNILLASSNCGLIMVFREEKNELDIKTFDILRSASLDDIPKQWSIVRQEVRQRLMKLFYRINVISTLISSTWPVDNLAYILAKLITESDN